MKNYHTWFITPSCLATRFTPKMLKSCMSFHGQLPLFSGWLIIIKHVPVWEAM